MAQNYNDLDAHDKKRISELIISQKVSLFVGSGVSKDSRGIRGHMELASELNKRLNDFSDLPSSTSLQRAYSFLSKKDVETELTDVFKCQAAGETVRRISDFPWRRVYTLNIDDCFEVAFGETAKIRNFSDEEFEVLNFSDSFKELSTSTRCSLVHLHGTVSRPEDGYIFSTKEYAKSLTSPNSWMLTLCQQIRTDMFIFAGTSLDEVDVEFYLEQRTQAGSRADLPKSILVEPYPNKITNKICEDHNFTLYEGTISELLEDLRQHDSRLQDPWVRSHDDGLSEIISDRAEKLKFSSAFDVVPRDTQRSTAVDRFLLGAELSWEMVASNADLARDVYPTLRRDIDHYLFTKKSRLYLILDQPGTGKTSLMKRMAFDLSLGGSRVFWYTGLGLELEPQRCAQIFDSIEEDVYVFVDNFADFLNVISLILQRTKKQNIMFVASEREYRLGYIEASFSGENFVEDTGRLKLTKHEAHSLRDRHLSAGLSTIQSVSDKKYLAGAIGRPIVEVSCRIQNSFKQLDRIVKDLRSECQKDEIEAYLVISLARHCFSAGVRRSSASEITYSDSIEFLLSESAPLTIKYSDFGKNFLVPKNPLIGDRSLEEARKGGSDSLLQAFSDLAIALAPRVTPAAIKRKTPEAQLLGRLMDYDHNVKRFIDDKAEQYYANLKRVCGWNARYWEQVALLKLDRFLASPEDVFLLDESIQHARSAISAELHPFSLATLAKVLFKAMERNPGARDTLFAEAWESIIEADEREQRWSSRGATVYVICFSGVIKFIEMGGLLSGSQADSLRDMIAATYSHKFRDKGLLTKRDCLSKLLP